MKKNQTNMSLESDLTEKSISEDCRDAMDIIFEMTEEKNFTMLQRISSRIHLFFCPRCTDELKKLDECMDLLHSEFFPPSPSFESRVMEQLSDEITDEEFSDVLIAGVPGGFSFRSWVVIGLFFLISIFISFLGLDYYTFTASLGATFLIALGITTGIMLTGYGAFFIASHLKELATHFKIHQ